MSMDITMDIDYPPSNTSNIYSQTFKRWKGLYEQLASTLDSFLAECTNLEKTLRQPGAREWPELERSLVAVDATLTSLPLFHTQIDKAQTIIRTTRNRSASLVPFNRLPLETFTYILSLVSANCICSQPCFQTEDDRPVFPLTSLLLTSKHLNDIATSVPELWAHIDLVTGESVQAKSYKRYSRTCLRRSKQALLTIHAVSELMGEPEEDPELISLLAPHAHRIVALHLQVPAALVYETIFALYSSNPSCQVRRLYIRDESYSSIGSQNLYHWFYHGNLDAFIEPLEVLSIHGPHTILTGAAFRGLTVLKLSEAHSMEPPQSIGKPTLLQFASVLSSSPEIRLLSIVGCTFDTTARTLPEPVVLPKLAELDLRVTGDEQLLSLLSCMVPSSGTLTFNTSLYKRLPENEMTRLWQFMRQSNVTRLCVETSCTTIEFLDWFLTCPEDEISPIQELALTGFDLTVEPIIKRPLDMRRFPVLRTLHLLECQLERESCRQILESSAIQTIYVDKKTHIFDARTPGLGPSVHYRSYSTHGYNDGDYEWPVLTVSY